MRELGEVVERRLRVVLREPVADAAHRLDDRVMLAEFLAQRANVHVDVSIGDDGVLPDDSAQQLRAREYAPWVLRQKVKQPYLRRRKGYGLAVNTGIVVA